MSAITLNPRAHRLSCEIRIHVGGLNSRSFVISLISKFLACLVVGGLVQVQMARAVGPDDFYGVECYKSFEPLEATRFHDLGVRWVRLWVDVPLSWIPSAPTETINAAQSFKNQGFKVLVVFNFSHQSHADVGTRQNVKAYFDWLLANTTMANVADVWEIGNEVGYDKYWKGTLTQYVNEVLRGAYESLNPAGQKVAGGCLDAWQKQSNGEYAYGMWQAQQLMSLNFKQYLHYISAHIYRNNPNQMIETLDGFISTYNIQANDPKPLLITEWNFLNADFKVSGGFDLNKWRDYFARVKPYVYSQATQGRVRTVFYYRSTAISGEGSWPGLLKADANRTPQEPLYSQYKNWAKYPGDSVVVAQTLGASADAYVSAQNPTTNYGASGQVRVLGGTWDPRTGYFKFNLAGIQNIGSARLRLYGGRLSGSGNIPVTVRHVLDSSWSESAINHQNRPTNLGILQDRPRNVNAAGWYLWDVTGAAEANVGGSMTVQLTQTNTAELFFHSKENSSNNPELIVETLEQVHSGQQLFFQDFASGGTPSNYVSSTPDSGQFTYIGQTGGAWSITGGKLRFATTGNVYNYASVVRRADFAGPPTVLIWQWKMSVANNTSATSNAIQFMLGSNFSNNYSDEAWANRWATINIGLSGTAGSFTLGGQTFSGERLITIAANRSGSPIEYETPAGNLRSLASQRYDVWVGGTLVVNAASPGTASAELRNL
ncbi:MAG: DNRLRE domain-containing protein, partial [Verrucomicrobiia bacterium]